MKDSTPAEGGVVEFRGWKNSIVYIDHFFRCAKKLFENYFVLFFKELSCCVLSC